MKCVICNKEGKLESYTICLCPACKDIIGQADSIYSLARQAYLAGRQDGYLEELEQGLEKEL